MECWDETRAERRSRTGATHSGLRRRFGREPGDCHGDVRRVGQTRRRADVGECLACGAILVSDFRARTLDEFRRGRLQPSPTETTP